MRLSSDLTFGQLPPDAQEHLETICTAFEAAWRSGSVPSIADALKRLERPEWHEVLFRELLRIELHWRRRRGESPEATSYESEFPAMRTLVDAEFRLFVTARNGKGDRGADSTTTAFALRDSEPTPNARPLTSGVPNIPGYEILSEVARGGMGVVYRARQTAFDRIVALKMMLSGNFASEQERGRFQLECQAAGQLQHPLIVPVYESGVCEGQPFFSMEFVEGDSLKAIIADGPLPPGQAADLIRLLAGAVHYAHGRGVVHRDLKPTNILIDQYAQPRITDFGLAKRIETDSSLTSTGQVLGTPCYMPPEQALGRTHQIGPAADVYALGAVLYSLLTGRPPFQAATVVDTLLQVVNVDPVSPRRLNPSVPRDLETICLKCLQKDTSKRYSTAAELAEDVGRFQAHVPIRARPVGPVEKAIKWGRRHPLLGLTLAVAVCLAVGISGWLMTRPAWLDVQVNPPTASVRIDGSEVALQDGRLTLPAGPGRHEIEVDAEGYLPARQSVVAVRGRDNIVSASFSLESILGHLAADSFPPNATIELREANGTLVMKGAMPFHSPALPAGDYELKVSQSLYETKSLTVQVPSGLRTNSLDAIVLKPAFEGSESYERFRRRMEVMEKRIRLEAFAQLPLQAAMARISKAVGVGISIDKPALEAEGIDKEHPLTTSETGELSLETLLHLMLRPLGLTAFPQADGETIWIEVTTLTRADVANESVLFSLQGTGFGDRQGLSKQPLLESLYSLPRTRWQANSGAGGTAEVIDSGVLKVTQSWLALRQIDKYLLDLRRNALPNSFGSWQQTSPVNANRLNAGQRILDRRRAWQAIRNDLQNSKEDPPSPKSVTPLQKRLAQFAQEFRSSPEGVEAQAAVSERRWPLDALKAESTDEKDRAAFLDGIPNRRVPGLIRVLGDSRWKQWNSILAIAFSPDGKSLATGGADECLNLWDVESGNRRRCLVGPLASIESVAFSPDGERIAAGGWNGLSGCVAVWSLSTGRLLTQFDQHESSVTSVRFLPRSSLIASACRTPVDFLSVKKPNPIRLWDASSGKLVRSLEDHAGTINSLSAHPDGTMLVSAGRDLTVRVWNVQNAAISHRWKRADSPPDPTGKGGYDPRFPPADPPFSAEFTPDGEAILLWGEPGDHPRLWRLDRSEPIRLANREAQGPAVKRVVIGPDSLRFATVDDGSRVQLHDLATGKRESTIPLPHPEAKGFPAVLAFSSQGELAVGTSTGGVKIFRKGELEAAADGSTAAPKNISEYRSKTPECMIWSLQATPAGDRMATLDGYGQVVVWNLIDGSMEGTFQGDRPTRRGTLAGFDTEGRVIVAGREGATALFDPSDGTFRKWADGTPLEFDAIASDPLIPSAAGNGYSLACGSPDGSMFARVTEGRACEIVRRDGSATRVQTTAYHVTAIAFSPDSSQLALGNPAGIVTICDSTTGVQMAPQLADSSPVDSAQRRPALIMGVAWSPDGQLLAAACHSGCILIHDRSGKRHPIRIDMEARPLGVAWNPDGQWLAASTDNGVVYLWSRESDFRQEHILPVGPSGGMVWQVEFSPEGRHLLVGNGNGTISVIRIAEALKELEDYRILPPEATTAAIEPPSESHLLWSDEFDDPKSGFPSGKFNSFIERGYRDGHYFIRHSAPAYTWFSNKKFQDSFTCRVTGRVLKSAKSRWGLKLGPKRNLPDHGFEVLLSGDGRWQVVPANTPGVRLRTPYIPLTRHAAIKTGDEFNELTINVTGRIVALSCNGVPLCRPFGLEREVLPLVVGLRLYTADADEAEFERIQVWRNGDQDLSENTQEK